MDSVFPVRGLEVDGHVDGLDVSAAFSGVSTMLLLLENQ